MVRLLERIRFLSVRCSGIDNINSTRIDCVEDSKFACKIYVYRLSHSTAMIFSLHCAEK